MEKHLCRRSSIQSVSLSESWFTHKSEFVPVWCTFYTDLHLPINWSCVSIFSWDTYYSAWCLDVAWWLISGTLGSRFQDTLTMLNAWGLMTWSLYFYTSVGSYPKSLTSHTTTGILATCRYSDVQYELLKTQSSLISCIELKVWHMKVVFSLVYYQKHWHCACKELIKIRDGESLSSGGPSKL